VPGECKRTCVNGSFTIKGEDGDGEFQVGWDAILTRLGTHNTTGHPQLLEE